MQIEIRMAQNSDRDSITRFQIAMALETENYELDCVTVQKGVEAVLGNSSLGVYYVAIVEGEVVGSLLTTYEWSDWRNGTVLWIQSVYVDSSYRQRGIYAALYSHVKRMVAANESLRGIRLYVDESNKKAMDVYARLGMNGEHYRVFEWMKE